MTDTIRVVIVDDHLIVRRGLRDLFETEADIEVVGEASDGAEAVAVVASVSPDVVLMDLSMPNVDGISAIKQLVEKDPSVQIVVLTSMSDQDSIVGALQEGAVGYVLKHSDPEVILSAIRAAMTGGSIIDPQATRTFLLAGSATRRRPIELTDRETEVLRAVHRGLANKQIARELRISERTVKAHLTHIFQRIDVTDRTQAALWAHENLPPE